eukprot:scaffold23294_cov35-Tisochrysis_lutea.AAC.3
MEAGRRRGASRPAPPSLGPPPSETRPPQPFSSSPWPSLLPLASPSPPARGAPWTTRCQRAVPSASLAASSSRWAPQR